MECYEFSLSELYEQECNIPKKKVLVISNSKFSQETAVLRKIVVRAKTLP